ncbi:MAG: hypothetical protein JWR15_488 [Prosthecobacter sp.]|nr:hypothetical protein [Prosthecobacter sp.]
MVKAIPFCPMPDTNKPVPANDSDIPLKALAEESLGALHPNDSVQTAGIRMRDHEAGKWPVAKDHKLIGMIDQENPDWEIGGHGHDPKAWKVGQIMTHDTVFCYEDEDCAKAEQLMEESGLSYLPVVDRQMHIVGIFSRAEIQAKAQAAAVGASETTT